MNKVLIIKNMKKYIISALTFLISFINVEAQYVADGHHMSYKGVSFEESLHDFRQQIKNKGISFNTDNPQNEAYCLGSIESGPLANEILAVHYDNKNDRVTKVSVSTFSRFLSDAKPKMQKVLKNIQQTYPNALFDCCACKNEYGSRIEKYCWNILSADRQYMLGSVYVTLDFDDEDPHYCMDVTVTDAYNCMLAEDVFYGHDHISDVMYPDYDSFNYFIDEDNLIFYPVKNKQVGMVLVTGDDRKKILDLIFNSGCSKQEIRRQISNYLKPIPIFNSKFLCTTSGCFNSKDLYWGYRVDPNARVSDWNPQQQYTQSNKPQPARTKTENPVEALQRDFFEGIMGKELIDFYKQNGSYEMMFGLSKTMTKAILGGNGTSYMDELSPAQRAVIHEHDNAR